MGGAGRRPDLGHVGRVARHPVGVAERDQRERWPRRWCGSGGRTRRRHQAGPAWRARPRPAASWPAPAPARRRCRRPGPVTGRRSTTPGRTRSKCASAWQASPRELARWRICGCRAASLGQCERLPESAPAAPAPSGGPARRRSAKWLQTPTISTRPSAGAGQRGIEQRRPVGRRRPGPVQPGIDVRCTRAGRPAAAAAARRLSHHPRRAGRQVDPGCHRRRAGLSGPASQAMIGASMPAARSAERLIGRRATPSQLAPASSAARAHGQHAVPVAVGLDDGHHRGAPARRTSSAVEVRTASRSTTASHPARAHCDSRPSRAKPGADRSTARPAAATLASRSAASGGPRVRDGGAAAARPCR